MDTGMVRSCLCSSLISRRDKNLINNQTFEVFFFEADRPQQNLFDE